MFRLKKEKKYRVGIVSDSHNYVSKQMLAILKTCDYVLHAGDVTTECVLDQFRAYGRFYLVRGNSDRDQWAYRIAKRQLFKIGGLTFLMVHDQMDAGRLVEKADIVIHGHTHRYSEEVFRGRLWLNPGSCGSPRYGQASMVVMEIQDKQYTIQKIILQDV